MTTTLRKTLALLLCLCMCLSLVPAAFAEEPAFGEEEVFSFEEPAFGEEPVEEEPAFTEEPFTEEPFAEEPFAEEPAFSEEPAEEEPIEEEPAEEAPAEEAAAEEPEQLAEEPEAETEPAEEPVFEAEEVEDFDAEARSGVWYGLRWTLSSEGHLSITGSGEMHDYEYSSSAGWASYKCQIKSASIGYGVTSIGAYAFRSCSNLTSITIPDSVTSIGRDAFYYCSSLTSVNIPDSVTSIGIETFFCCSSLKSATIGNSVTAIGNDTFRYCCKLTSVTLGNSVTSIGKAAFYYCSSLTSVNLPDGVTSIGDEAFLGCHNIPRVSIPGSVTSIGDRAFEECKSLTSVTIPDSVTSIGYAAFDDCRSLTSAIISNSITVIANSTFYNCKNLTSVTIPNRVTSIGDYAFCYCSSLASVTIPKSVSTIKVGAFDGCSSLTDVYYSGSQEQRDAINIDNGNEWLSAAIWHIIDPNNLPAPTLISATASGSSIVFKWNAVDGAAKYRVYRKVNSGAWTALANVAGTSYTDTNVTRGTVYTYTARCLNAAGQTVSGFNAAGKSGYVPLPTPTLVSAAVSGNSIVFKWNAVNGAAKYRVYRKINSGAWTALANVAGTSYTDTNVTRGTLCTYTVRCLNAAGQTVSGFNAAGKSAFIALATPTPVSAAASGSSIVFKWNAVNGAAKYRVYRKYAGVNWTALANVSGTSYTDTNVTKGTVYTYAVRCVTDDGKTCVSGFNATGKSAFITLPTPILVSATASGSSIVFRWLPVSGAAKYRVYRKTAGGSWTALANVAGTSYTDTNVTRGTTYTYTVRCVTADGKTCVSGFNATGKSARVG